MFSRSWKNEDIDNNILNCQITIYHRVTRKFSFCKYKTKKRLMTVLNLDSSLISLGQNDYPIVSTLLKLIVLRRVWLLYLAKNWLIFVKKCILLQRSYYMLLTKKRKKIRIIYSKFGNHNLSLLRVGINVFFNWKGCFLKNMCYFKMNKTTWYESKVKYFSSGAMNP